MFRHAPFKPTALAASLGLLLATGVAYADNPVTFDFATPQINGDNSVTAELTCEGEALEAGQPITLSYQMSTTSTVLISATDTSSTGTYTQTLVNHELSVGGVVLEDLGTGCPGCDYTTGNITIPADSSFGPTTGINSTASGNEVLTSGSEYDALIGGGSVTVTYLAEGNSSVTGGTNWLNQTTTDSLASVTCSIEPTPPNGGGVPPVPGISASGLLLMLLLLPGIGGWLARRGRG